MAKSAKIIGWVGFSFLCLSAILFMAGSIFYGGFACLIGLVVLAEAGKEKDRMELIQAVKNSK